MPDQIKIESGLTAGTCHWVKKSVTRIGSGTNADICLPSSEVPAHAITLELRNDLYSVYNRTKRSFAVGDNDVAPGEVMNWLDGETIALPDGTSMTLQLDVEFETVDSPTSEQAIEDKVDEIDLDDLDIDVPAKSKRRLDPAVLKQLLLLAGCVVTVLLFVGNFSSTEQSSSPRFDQIITAGLENELSSKPLLQDLRFAEAALIRKDTEMAKYLFNSIHEKLVAQKNRFVAEDRAIELAILNYVQSQVRRLNQSAD
jgi:hypothetical protein